MHILFFAVEEGSRGEGQGSGANALTRNNGEVDVSQPEMATAEIKIEMDMAVDPFCIHETEPHSCSKLFIRQ